MFRQATHRIVQQQQHRVATYISHPAHTSTYKGLLTTATSVSHSSQCTSHTCSLHTSRPSLAESDRPASTAGGAGATTGLLNLRFSTPNETIVNNEPVYCVTVPAVTGVMGILADHAPTIAQLIPGLVTVYKDDINNATHRLYVSGGFALMNSENACTITAVEAIKLDDLDIGQARQGLTDAQGAVAKAVGEKEKAEAQVAVEVLEGVVNALEQQHK